MTCSIRKKCAGSQIPQSKEKSISMLDVAQTGRRWSQNTHTQSGILVFSMQSLNFWYNMVPLVHNLFVDCVLPRHLKPDHVIGFHPMRTTALTTWLWAIMLRFDAMETGHLTHAVVGWTSTPLVAGYPRLPLILGPGCDIIILYIYTLYISIIYIYIHIDKYMTCIHINDAVWVIPPLSMVPWIKPSPYRQCTRQCWMISSLLKG